MTAARRWLLVALGVLLLVSLPLAVGRGLPAHAAPVSAASLLDRARSSGAVAYSGKVETQGNLGLPVSDQFTDLADLFGQRTTLRVWWRGADDWRVDRIVPTGETDLFHDARGTTSWDFESDRATRTGLATIRLPQTSDLLPPILARQLLSGARDDQITRLGAARIAGIAAPGLRLRPRDGLTSITRVDVWVEPRTGLPLRIAVYGASGTPALTSSFTSVSLTAPAAAVTRFTLAPGARSRFEDVVDIAAAANAYAPLAAPATLIGLASSSATPGAVGVYGRGVSRLIAIPLRSQVATPLLAQISITPGSTATANGVALSVDPLNLLLTDPFGDGHSWLLAGTVSPASLDAAAHELAGDRLSRNAIRPPGLP